MIRGLAIFAGGVSCALCLFMVAGFVAAAIAYTKQGEVK